jgi:hypothetical protein
MWAWDGVVGEEPGACPRTHARGWCGAGGAAAEVGHDVELGHTRNGPWR